MTTALPTSSFSAAYNSLRMFIALFSPVLIRIRTLMAPSVGGCIGAAQPLGKRLVLPGGVVWLFGSPGAIESDSASPGLFPGQKVAALRRTARRRPSVVQHGR
jgi:hypothetical protein